MKTPRKSRHDLTVEQMKRMVYKELVDTNPELVEKRLKERKEKLYKAVLRELPEAEARKYADAVFWWVKDKLKEKQKTNQEKDKIVLNLEECLEIIRQEQKKLGERQVRTFTRGAIRLIEIVDQRGKGPFYEPGDSQKSIEDVGAMDYIDADAELDEAQNSLEKAIESLKKAKERPCQRIPPKYYKRKKEGEVKK